MNRIDELFQKKQGSVLSVYFTAGYPEINDTNLIISGLEKAGADLIEIGFPFSDPVADGPVIQASSHQSILNGMNLDILFDQLQQINKSSNIPKILMGYFNTVYQYSIERFISRCQECNISGVIIPDLPPEVYNKDYRKLFESAGIHFICLVAPKTSPERMKYLESLSGGFIYRLSSSSTTGNKLSLDMNNAMGPLMLNIPSLIGFGIHDRQTFETACSQANGAIIGTAFIRYLNENIKYDGDPDVENQRSAMINKICLNFLSQFR